MSSLIVTVTKISNVKAHPNADRLEILEVLGWQLVEKKGRYNINDKVIYIPPDSIVPVEISDKIGATQYLSNQRIKPVKLRGEPSYGLVVPMEEGCTWEEGYNCANDLGIKKYEPPVSNVSSGGQTAPDHPLFHKYTDIENLRNFPYILKENEEIIITEKLHGQNNRNAYIDGQVMAGSHKRNIKRPVEGEKPVSYWYPYEIPEVKNLVDTLGKEHKSVILFGEVFGRVQSLRYGMEKDERGLLYRAFDLSIDGKYLDFDDFKNTCDKFGVNIVPVLYRGPYSLDIVKKFSKGNTTVNNAAHIREGCVVKPTKERYDNEIKRVVLKYLNDDYLTGDLYKEDTTDY